MGGGRGHRVVAGPDVLGRKLELPAEDTWTGTYTIAATAAHAEVTSLVVYTAPFNHGGP